MKHLPFAPESHAGKRFLGMTAEDLNFTEEEFDQLIDNLGETGNDET
jgi:hypothetical protein